MPEIKTTSASNNEFYLFEPCFEELIKFVKKQAGKILKLKRFTLVKSSAESIPGKCA